MDSSSKQRRATRPVTQADRDALEALVKRTLGPSATLAPGALPRPPRSARRMPFRWIWAFFGERAKRALLDLANTDLANIAPPGEAPNPFDRSPVDWGGFREQWGRLFLRGESDEELCNLSSELHQHWDQGPEALVYLAHRWAVRPETPPPSGTVNWFKFTNRQGAQLSAPVLFDLKRALALAILDLAPALARCANPDCPMPYFLKGRFTQRFCDRRECAAFGQRQHALAWWRKHGPAWRRAHKRKARRH